MTHWEGNGAWISWWHTELGYIKMSLLKILVGTHHGIQVKEVLHHPIQGIHQVHARLPYFTHHIQYSGGSGHMPLGDGDGRGG